MYVFLSEIANVLMLIFSLIIIFLLFLTQKIFISAQDNIINDDDSNTDNINLEILDPRYKLIQNVKINTLKNSITYRNIKSNQNKIISPKNNNTKNNNKKVKFVENDIIEEKIYYIC